MGDSKYSDKAASLRVGDNIEVSPMYYRIHDLDCEISRLKRVNEAINNFLKKVDINE